MSKFDKSLFSDKHVLVARHVRQIKSAKAYVEQGPVTSCAEQLRVALDDLERLAGGVLERHGLTGAEAVTMPVNTAVGRAGRIVQGIQHVRSVLVSPAATEAALQTYRLMQQFAAAAVDEWREEVRRGVDSVDRQRKAAASSKKRQGYLDVAKELTRRYGSDPKPGSIWKKLKGDEAKPPPAWNMGEKVVRISPDGRQISCSGEKPITRRVFLEIYLKPAQEEAAKG